MDEKRKSELKSKGAIVAWTSATRNGLAHLFCLKSLGNEEYCLMREALLDEGDKRIAPKGRNWIIEDEGRMGLLVMSLTNMLRLRTIGSKKHYVRGIKEVIRQGRKNDYTTNQRLQTP